MAIDREARHPQRVTEDDVRGLAPHTRKGRQLVHRGRDLTAVFVDERVRHADQGFRFVTEEAGRQDERLDV